MLCEQCYIEEVDNDNDLYLCYDCFEETIINFIEEGEL